jgi:signal transduction histidine kinase
MPRIIAAQRLQSWLLLLVLVAMLISLWMIFDLARNTRNALVAETRSILVDAALALCREAPPLPSARSEREQPASGILTEYNRTAEPTSYRILRGYHDVEGGYLVGDQIAGHSFPTHTEPGSILSQPLFERELVLQALQDARLTGQAAVASGMEDEDLVIVAVCASSDPQVAGWALRRIFRFNSNEGARLRIVIIAVIVFALITGIVVLRLSFRLQQEFSALQEGLERLRSDPGFRLGSSFTDLKPIALAVNEMAESRQRLEAALRREDRLSMMGKLVAGIAHEIRNPLNSIRLNVRLLARRLRGEPDAEEPIGIVVDEIDRLDRILQGLSAFRLNTPADLRQQALLPILQRTLALVNPYAEEQGVKVRLAASESLHVYVDDDLLKQALINLLLNAIEVSRDRGDVHILADQQPGLTRIVIEDSGPGIPPEIIGKIFDAFFTTKSGGTGLGLAVTRTLLEKMQATVECENGPSGARFRILIPDDACNGNRYVVRS